ncbi:peptidoglycan-binding domain-containing protein [Pseudalkalibacillus caeni]|nr:peptidoglycan-binding protein [Pseudalkalibacillus caeni]
MAVPGLEIRGVQKDFVIQYGDRGPGVKRIQEYLIKAGMDLREHGVDGIFGPETLGAVRKFQRMYGLIEDGIVGPNTLGQLKKVLRNPGLQGQENPVRPYPGHYVMIGDRGRDVEAIQRAVNVTPDGIFGPVTEHAVRQYQGRMGLQVDGIIGPATWNVLF